MDALQLVRLQTQQNIAIVDLETEISDARCGKENLKEKIDSIDTEIRTVEDKITTAINGLSWKKTVATFEELEERYPDAEDGWCANVTEDGMLYRYTVNQDGVGSWIQIASSVIPLANENIDGLMSSADFVKLKELDAAKYLKVVGEETQVVEGKIKSSFEGDLKGTASNATSAEKVANTLTINGTVFDGSVAQSITVSEKVHSHVGTDVTLAGLSENSSENGAGVLAEDTVNSAIQKIEESLVGKAKVSHIHGASDITTMSGYIKPANKPSNLKVSAADSLNDVVGKIEHALEDKAALGHVHNGEEVSVSNNYVSSGAGIIVAGDSLDSALAKLETKINEKTNSNHNHTTNEINVVSGYAKGNKPSNTAIVNGDTLNGALAKIEHALDSKLSSVGVEASVTYITHNVELDTAVIRQDLATANYVEGDIVEVYISGCLLKPNYHYVLSFDGTIATLTTSESTTAGNLEGWLTGEELTFKVVKVTA